MIHYCMIIIIVNLRFFFEFVNKVISSLNFIISLFFKIFLVLL